MKIRINVDELNRAQESFQKQMDELKKSGALDAFEASYSSILAQAAGVGAGVMGNVDEMMKTMGLASTPLSAELDDIRRAGVDIGLGLGVGAFNEELLRAAGLSIDGIEESLETTTKHLKDLLEPQFPTFEPSMFDRSALIQEEIDRALNARFRNEAPKRRRVRRQAGFQGGGKHSRVLDKDWEPGKIGF